MPRSAAPPLPGAAAEGPDDVDDRPALVDVDGEAGLPQAVRDVLRGELLEGAHVGGDAAADVLVGARVEEAEAAQHPAVAGAVGRVVDVARRVGPSCHS